MKQRRRTEGFFATPLSLSCDDEEGIRLQRGWPLLLPYISIGAAGVAVKLALVFAQTTRRREIFGRKGGLLLSVVHPVQESNLRRNSIDDRKVGSKRVKILHQSKFVCLGFPPNNETVTCL